MTAINMICQRRRAFILTDGAGYDVNGVIRGFYSKTVTLPHLRAAVAVRGSIFGPALFATEWGARFTSFDDLVKGGGAVAEEVYDRMFTLLTAGGHVEIEIFLAGWSESRNRPETYWMASDDSLSRIAADVPSWMFILAEPFQVAPMPTEDLLIQQGFDVDDIERLDPVTDGLKVMEAQRLSVGTLSADSGPVSAVGGFASLTEIREDGVSQRIIRRWNDSIGEKIKPERVVMSDTITYMSRQQRRAAERGMRKARVTA